MRYALVATQPENEGFARGHLKLPLTFVRSHGEAIERLRTETYHMVILDEGIEPVPNVPVITNPNDILESFRNGAIPHIARNCSWREFRTVLSICGVLAQKRRSWSCCE